MPWRGDTRWGAAENAIQQHQRESPGHHVGVAMESAAEKNVQLERRHHLGLAEETTTEK